MPRIDAPTVAEHHARRRAALVAAAGDLLATEGVEGVTLAAAGAAAGLARSSVYQYFDSAGSLLAATVEAALPRATAELAAAVARAGAPLDRVEAWVRASVAGGTDPAHRSMADLGGMQLPEACRARLAELHAAQQAPLEAALAEHGVAEPALVAELLSGLVRTAAASINAGADAAAVTQRAVALVLGACGATD
ncbi:MAG TPA: TetR family transcriptional regulator [Candidatus Nanopelagicales bacterium]